MRILLFVFIIFNAKSQKNIELSQIADFSKKSSFQINSFQLDSTLNRQLQYINKTTLKPTQFVFKPSLSEALLRSIKSNLTAEKIINVKIISLDFKENKPNSSNLITGKFEFSLEFYSIREGNLNYLTEYSYSSAFSRDLTKDKEIDKIISNGFRKAFVFLEEWFITNKKKSSGLAKGVKVITNEINVSNADTISYQNERPLLFEDFKGSPHKPTFAAVIFSSFGYNALAQVIDGKVVLEVNIFCYMVPNMSWMRLDARNEYTLNHEQMHFNISKIVSHQFKVNLDNYNFSTDDWESEIRYFYLDYYRKLSNMQELYDLETKHGLNIVKQSEWNIKIKDLMNKFGN